MGVVAHVWGSTYAALADQFRESRGWVPGIRHCFGQGIQPQAEKIDDLLIDLFADLTCPGGHAVAAIAAKFIFLSKFRPAIGTVLGGGLAEVEQVL
jgi:hypothetical protein